MSSRPVGLFAVLAGASALVLVFSTRPAAQTAAADWPSIAARMGHAAVRADVTGVKEARNACLSLLAATPAPANAAVIRYTIAYGDWRLAFAPSISPAEQDDFVRDAEAQLTEAIKSDARFADAVALLSVVYGTQIVKNPDLGMSLGMQVAETMDRAMRLDPSNPRVAILHGQTLFHTPEEFGGSVKGAELEFRRALDLLAKEPADKAWPNWGRFEAHVWLGQALASRGDTAGARAEYNAALEIVPESDYVKFVLLAALGK